MRASPPCPRPTPSNGTPVLDIPPNTASQSLEDKTAGEGPAEASDEEKEASLWSRCSAPTDPQRPQHVTLRRHVFSPLTTSCHMTAHRHFLPHPAPHPSKVIKVIHQKFEGSGVTHLHFLSGSPLPPAGYACNRAGSRFSRVKRRVTHTKIPPAQLAPDGN